MQKPQTDELFLVYLLKPRSQFFHLMGYHHGVLLLGSILGYVAAFAVAMGPIPWIVNSEIFPTKLRGRAMSIAIFMLWLADFIVTQTFPMLRESIGPARTFWVYAFCSLLSTVFVVLMVPETKGRTLEEIEASWLRAKPGR